MKRILSVLLGLVIRPGVMMPGCGRSIGDADIAALADYLRSSRPGQTCRTGSPRSARPARPERPHLRVNQTMTNAPNVATPQASPAATTRFTVNGKPVSVQVDAVTPLLWVIRDEIGLKGTKFGCGIGMCGACTVHVDGRAIRSCITPLDALAGAAITTIEGLAPQGDGAHSLQLAWIAAQASQCGYCQSGQIMQAAQAIDIPSKSDGSAVYGIDAVIDNMVHARPLIRPTRYGATGQSIDDTAARQSRGYLKSIALQDPSGTVPGWVVVLADSFSAAERAAGQVRVTWTAGPAAKVSKDDLQAQAPPLIGDARQGALVVDDPGVEAAFAAARLKVEYPYTTGTVLHFQLEPVNALALEKEGVWHIHTGNQWQPLALPVVAKALGAPSFAGAPSPTERSYLPLCYLFHFALANHKENTPCIRSRQKTARRFILRTGAKAGQWCFHTAGRWMPTPGMPRWCFWLKWAFASSPTTGAATAARRSRGMATTWILTLTTCPR